MANHLQSQVNVDDKENSKVIANEIVKGRGNLAKGNVEQRYKNQFLNEDKENKVVKKLRFSDEQQEVNIDSPNGILKTISRKTSFEDL